MNCHAKRKMTKNKEQTLKNKINVFYIAYSVLLQSASNSQQAAGTWENTNLVFQQVFPSTVCLQFLLCLFQPKVDSYSSTTVFVFTQCTQSPGTFMAIKINVIFWMLNHLP